MSAETVLVTGYPNYVARCLVCRLAEQGTKVLLLCKAEHEEGAANGFAQWRDRVDIVTGDVVNMDLGLSGPEVKRIRREVSRIFHLAAIYFLGSSEEEMKRVNVEGTANLLEFAGRLESLQRFLHYSTAFVSGIREGVIMEEDLVEPARFHNHFERTRFEAERHVRRAMADLPVTVVRPALVVGDSRTGEIDRLDGPHFFLHVLVNLPLNISLPLVGKGSSPLNLVPVDYVVEAMLRLAAHPDAIGRTFHLVDLNPLPSRAVFELLCQLARKKPPRGAIPTSLANYLLKMPGLEKHWRSPRLFIEMLDHLVLYNAMNATELLGAQGCFCPPFPSYAPNLVAFLKQRRLVLPGTVS